MTTEYVTVAPKKQQLQQQQQQFLEEQHQLQLQHHQQLLQLQQGSPHNSSSGKGSSTSTLTNLGSSTFKTNHGMLYVGHQTNKYKTKTNFFRQMYPN